MALAQQHNDPLFIFSAMPADPGYLGVITNWDGQWYQSIAMEGYQVPAPDDPDRDRLLWTWGFPPLFPFAVRAVMVVTRAPYPVAVTILNIAAAAVGMVLLYRMLRASGGTFLAVAGVALTSSFISAPLFQAAYSESLAFLFLMAFFTLLRARRYGWAVIVVLALAMTRIVTLPLAAVVFVHAWHRFRSREEGKPRLSEMRSMGALALCCVLGTLAWLVIASFFIGGEQGLARTQAQRELYLGWFSDTLRYGGAGVLGLLLALVLVIVLYAMSGASRGWGLDLRTWSVAYPVYILAISPIMPGTLRYLLLAPTLPLSLIGSAQRATWPRVVLLAALCGLSLVGQWWLVNELLVVSSLDQRFSP